MNEAEYHTMFEAEDRHWWYVALHELVLQSLPGNNGTLAIFDAGCGTGRLMELLALRGAAEGCDASATALSLCRKRGLTAVVKADLNTIMPRQERYDVITSIDVLYHRDITDDAAVLRKLYSALKPGGRLIFQVPAYEWLRSGHDDAVHTGRRYTRKQVKHMVQACGFVVEKATYRVTLLFVPLALIRLIGSMVRRRRAEPEAASDVRKHSTAVNGILSMIMKSENRLLKHCSLPFGASVFVVARKPEAPCGRRK